MFIKLRKKGNEMMKKQVFNPFLPSYEYIPDGEPYVFGDRLYLYGSHDRFNGKLFCMNDYVCWSVPINDLSDWRYEGSYLQENARSSESIRVISNVCARCCSRSGW